MKILDNAFELLTDEPEGIETYTARANIMDAITKLIAGRRWTRKDACKHMLVNKECIDDLFQGKLSKLPLNLLLQMIGRIA